MPILSSFRATCTPFDFIAEFFEQLMGGKDIRLLPFVDEGIDFGRDEFLQGAAGFVVVGGEEHV
jgi:hypothetical protein